MEQSRDVSAGPHHALLFLGSQVLPEKVEFNALGMNETERKR